MANDSFSSRLSNKHPHWHTMCRRQLHAHANPVVRLCLVPHALHNEVPLAFRISHLEIVTGHRMPWRLHVRADALLPRRCVQRGTFSLVNSFRVFTNARSTTYEGGTSYVFAGPSAGRRPTAIAAENGDVPPPGCRFSHHPHTVKTSRSLLFPFHPYAPVFWRPTHSYPGLENT